MWTWVKSQCPNYGCCRWTGVQQENLATRNRERQIVALDESGLQKVEQNLEAAVVTVDQESRAIGQQGSVLDRARRANSGVERALFSETFSSSRQNRTRPLDHQQMLLLRRRRFHLSHAPREHHIANRMRHKLPYKLQTLSIIKTER